MEKPRKQQKSQGPRAKQQRRSPRRTNTRRMLAGLLDAPNPVGAGVSVDTGLNS